MTLFLADILLPDWLVVSQWVLFFVFALLLILAYRQIAYLLGLRNIGTEHEGLPVGEKAPTFPYLPLGQMEAVATQFLPEGHWSLLLFVDPGCVSCQMALRALERVAAKLPQEVQVLLCTRSDQSQINSVEAFRTAALPLGQVEADLASRLYRTSTTPFLYILDASGAVQARGPVTDEATIRKHVHQVDWQTIKVGTRLSTKGEFPPFLK